MSDFTINWDDVLDEQTQDPSTGAAPDGPYDVRIVKAEATRASTGSPMIKLSCEITTGPYASKMVWTNLVFKTDSATTMRMVLQNLSALGVSREWIASNNPPLTTIASELTGAVGVAELTSREWQGELRNDVKRFKPSDTPTTTPETPPAPVVAPEATPAASSDEPPTPSF